MPTDDPSGTALALFPLHTVLVPGATLGLRVFEPRYLDLVRECGRNGTGFGVCLILDGNEVGAPARPADVGTQALIEDFGRDKGGLLTLQVRGVRRFRVSRAWSLASGRQLADIAWLDDQAPQPLQPQHNLLTVLLQSLLDRFGGEHALAPSALLDDADWVSWRLAELLPLANTHRLDLLQIDDPHQRLDRLLSLLH